VLPADGGAGAIVRVQLDSLEGYARELSGQISALESGQARFHGNPTFGGGGFGEAVGIDARHQEILGKMRHLLAQVRGGIDAARTAAASIAATYQSTDQLHSADLEDVTSRLGPAPTVSAPPSTRVAG
jgi:hypothetical protein